MIEYSPFLKFKSGELNALSKLLPDDRKNIVPLLELPRDNLYTENKLITKIDKSVNKMKKDLGADFSFYIDNYEVSDDIEIDGNDNYLYLIEVFKGFDIVPVIGFDRTKTHNSIGINYANKNSKKIALRVTFDYFDSFLAYKKDLESFLNNIKSDVLCIIILDCNYIDDSNVEIFGKNILKVLENIIGMERFNKIVLSGSSIPESIGTKVKTNTNVFINRNEVTLFKKIASIYPRASLVFGDYTVISPGYSELDIEPKLMLNVMTSKIIYSLLDSHYISRGRVIKKYGYNQYFSQAKDIIKKPFFRGRDYSWGDKYLFEKATHGGTNITQSTIIGPEVNAHIRFMIDEILKHSI
jgi:hypothetical protein